MHEAHFLSILYDRATDKSVLQQELMFFYVLCFQVRISFLGLRTFKQRNFKGVKGHVMEVIKNLVFTFIETLFNSVV